MFFLNGYFYTISIVLQAICVIHCVRKGNQGKWIWLIVFLPMVGSLIYIFTEIFNSRDLQRVQSGVGSILNPSGQTRKLEENLRFSDTFQNRVQLADAYLNDGLTDKAIELYQSSLTGNFNDNEHVLSQLVIAYCQVKRYDEAIALAEKIYRRPQFARSYSHILYAVALDNVNRTEDAEKEFKLMLGRYANFQARYHYGLFLIRNDREAEAHNVFNEMLAEKTHLSSMERRDNRKWFQLAKEQLAAKR